MLPRDMRMLIILVLALAMANVVGRPGQLDSHGLSNSRQQPMGSSCLGHYATDTVLTVLFLRSTAESEALSAALKKAGMTFVGPTIMYAFMQAAGLVNDHLVSCHCRSEMQQDASS